MVFTRLSRKDADVIVQLRNNARVKVTKIARDSKTPPTTVYDQVRRHEKRIIKKNVSLIDFTKIGFLSHAHLAFKVDRTFREELQAFLINKANINSVYRTNFDYDFLVEGIFRNVAELQHFKDTLEKRFSLQGIQVFNTVEELKKEDFLSKPEHFDDLA